MKNITSDVCTYCRAHSCAGPYFYLMETVTSATIHVVVGSQVIAIIPV